MEKVSLLKEIHRETNPQLRSAVMSLLNGGLREADMALNSQSQFSFRAIITNLMMFKFER